MVEFVRVHLSVERMTAYLADPDRELFVAEEVAEDCAEILAEVPTQAVARAVAEPTRPAPLSAPSRTGAAVEGDEAIRRAGRLLGYTMVVFAEPADPDVRSAITVRPTAELSKCYVVPGEHGSGAATQLITATIDAARRRGARAVWLGVNQRNDRANRFYERTGFTLVGVKRFLVGEQLHDDFVRELLL